VAHSHICDRAFGFAVRTVKLCEQLATRGFSARHLAEQLLQCGTSIGANAEEAQEGQTKKDYIAKLSISAKESREAHWWLRLIVATGNARADEVRWELGECAELRYMIRAALRTARSSSNRGGFPPK
jgi:four helix bundle protein